MLKIYELDSNKISMSIYISDLSIELKCMIRTILDDLKYIEEDFVYKYCIDVPTYDNEKKEYYDYLERIEQVLNNNGYECIN